MSKAESPDRIVSVSAEGLEELIGGARNWRVWHLLGLYELRHRYARSWFGQFWLVLSNAMMIGGLGLVWSLLWKQPLQGLMPFLGISLIMWHFMTQVLTECTMILTTDAKYYRNQKMNFSVSIYSVVYKNTLILAHNLVIIFALISIFRVPMNWYLLQIIPAFVVTWIMLLWVGYVTAMASARYRDIIQLITTWLMVWFFVTPVMWMPDTLPREYHFIIDYNPLAQFVELLRAPFLGQPVSAYTWFVTIVTALGGCMLALPVIGRYQRRVIFWI